MSDKTTTMLMMFAESEGLTWNIVVKRPVTKITDDNHIAFFKNWPNFQIDRITLMIDCKIPGYSHIIKIDDVVFYAPSERLTPVSEEHLEMFNNAYARLTAKFI